MADLILTDAQGVSVFHSNGSGFEPRIVVGYGMTYSADEFWARRTQPRVLADVDADGELEIVGFAHEGVLVGELGLGLDPIPVPEPSSLAGLAMGSALLVGLARRRRSRC